MVRANAIKLAFIAIAGQFLCVRGLGQPTCVTFRSSDSSFPVVSSGTSAPILLSSDDWPGVHRTALDFASDIERVTGVRPQLMNTTSGDASGGGSRPIIVGTLGRSSLIDAVVNATNLDVSSIEGLWEGFISKEVTNPLPGVDSAYVIIGSSKRGTIFGMYDLSEQFGVSPWYWWADVPTTKHEEIFLDPSGCSHGLPTVHYRGIFLNDERPDLQGWAAEKFTNGTGSHYLDSPFNHLFYAKLFELILRLKGNYLWPAMHASAFCIDDEQNQPLADYYGIVMGTSHQEPIMRSSPNEFDIFSEGPWDYHTNKDNIYEYWVEGAQRAKPYESLFTMGMRGAGDIPLEEGQDITFLEGIMDDQKQLLTDVFNGTDVATVPQVWALYKEVEKYYIGGLKVEDYITLLWPDDNWGNVHRYPTLDERNRTGGAGIYYHVNYVGVPRSYKWLTCSQIPKIYEQMSLGVDRNATRVWIVNVGDLKPHEREAEFFLTLAWNATRWNPDNVRSYDTSWAQREFDVDDSDAESVAEIIANLTRFNARRKPELLSPTTYSLTDYREAENVLAAWDKLLEASTAMYNKLPADTQPAFFQLVHHPVKASSNLGKIYIYAGLNNLRASQASLRTNALDDQVVELFEKDFDFETEYHSILDGKWNHMMDQTHMGYTDWPNPMANWMPPTTRVQSRKQSLSGVMRVIPEGTKSAWPGDVTIPLPKNHQYQCKDGFCPQPTLSLDPFNPIQNRYVDVSAGGPAPFEFTVTTNVSWVKLSDTGGSISPDNTEKRIFISVPDWSQVGEKDVALINFTAKGSPKDVTVPLIFTVNNTQSALPSTFKGFVEGGGVISMEAAHTARNTSVDGLSWRNLPGIGRTLSGITPWPRGGADANYTAGTGPSAEYDFYNFRTANMTVTVYISPSLNANGRDRPLAFAMQLDSNELKSSYYMPFGDPGQEPSAWGGTNGFVANSIVTASLNWTDVGAGAHTLKLFMIEPAVIVQKIVIEKPF
ncbi:hypothetical protein AAF712_014008 [Marasmius tenuissimus]|uniref:Gylcosyl hydrolase 115 C-terminal domain-containing protein n=1 Tax=Marasmius tenuissimus TaxID=585030 RepID=A0ABR2ZD61_9AGAR